MPFDRFWKQWQPLVVNTQPILLLLGWPIFIVEIHTCLSQNYFKFNICFGLLCFVFLNKVSHDICRKILKIVLTTSRSKVQVRGEYIVMGHSEHCITTYICSSPQRIMLYWKLRVSWKWINHYIPSAVLNTMCDGLV